MERRLMSAVGFDARPEAIAELLAGADPVDADALDDEGAAVRGLYAAETALFGEGSDALATTEGSRRCEYLTSALTLSLDAAEEVRADWSGPSRDTFVAGMDGTPQDTVNQLVNGGHQPRPGARREGSARPGRGRLGLRPGRVAPRRTRRVRPGRSPVTARGHRSRDRPG